MNKIMRLLIAIAMLLGIVLLAKDKVAWAESTDDPPPSILAQEDASVLLKHGPGTVKPPPRKIKVCREGTYSVGGVATLNVMDLAPHYCIRASLWKRHWPPVHVPARYGRILADVTFVEELYRNRFKKHLPEEDGRAEICYAVPPGKEAKIYFLDYYGKHKGKPTWTVLNTRVENGIACAPAQNSGAYALVGK
jgi:hypothetical protein